MNYESQKNMYDMFLLNEAYEQEKMNLFIQEAIMWTSKNVTKEKLLYFEEGIKDTAKEKLKNAWEVIKKAIRKVTGTVSNFFKSKESFLTSNEKIIKEKKVKYQEDFSLYPYTEGLKRIGKYSTPNFDYEKLKKADPNDFQSFLGEAYFNCPVVSSKDDLKDKCVEYFRGGNEKTYQANELNMTDMYNVCKDYNDRLLKPLNNDLAVIEDAHNKMATQLSKLNLNSSTTENSLFNDKPIYSYFMESYIIFNEEDKPDISPEKETDKLDTKTNNTPANKAGEHITNNKMSKSDSKYSNDLEQDVKGDNDEYKRLSELNDLYRETATAIANAKLEVVNEIYKKYWEIIEKHVTSYVGQAKDDKEGDTAKKSATDYANSTDPNYNKAVKNQQNVVGVEIAYGDNNSKQENPDDYYIQMLIRNADGKNDPKIQSVAAIYPSDKNDKDFEYIPGTTKIQQIDNVWRIIRKYKNKSDPNKTKTKAVYINPNKAEVNDQNLFKAGNVIN